MNDFTGDEIEQSVPELFEDHVRKYPQRIAFKSKKDALTWDGLNRAANRVARSILGMCESRERPIALLLDQGASIMAAIMGVVKTGGFYVLLGPSHPRARNSYILDETEATLIVTDSGSLSLAAELAQGRCQFLNMDGLDTSLSTENLGLPISLDSFLNVLYTSGSTGEPKGVVNTHRTVHRRPGDGHQMCADDRVALLGSAGRGFFSALVVNGAGLFPWNVKEEGLARLADWLIQEEITVYSSVPTVFRNFVSTLTGKEEFPKLRMIVLGGEAMYRTDIELYKKHFSSDCLLGLSFGTTETGSIRQYMIGKETNITNEIVPVGYEIPGKEVLLLDDNHQEVGFNQVGEIAVRSRYLSLGYWRRPDLTEAKFLPDPDGGDKRIYLTGDLGRMMPDGCLEHLGRKDFQVKIRGQRVEVTEVEGALRSISTIREAVVMAREDKAGGPSAPLRTDKRLVAYIVPEELTLSITEVRKVLEQKLPDFMVPSSFVLLDALPLTPNGKVNLQALPAPGRERPEMASPFVPPSTSIEKLLAKIWAELLGLDQVGLHDHFLDLGGNSLLAARVVSRILATLQVELPMRSLFDSPTIAEMAMVIVQNQGERIGQEDLTRMLVELEALSDEDAQGLISQVRERHE